MPFIQRSLTFHFYLCTGRGSAYVNPKWPRYSGCHSTCYESDSPADEDDASGGVWDW